MCMCVSERESEEDLSIQTTLFFAMEGDVHMKRVNKKWQTGQEGIVVGGSRRTAEFQTEREREGKMEQGGPPSRRGGKNVCVKENKREIKRGGWHRQKRDWGILPDKICANVCVNESSDYS